MYLILLTKFLLFSVVSGIYKTKLGSSKKKWPINRKELIKNNFIKILKNKL